MNPESTSIEGLQQWVGRTEQTSDEITRVPAAALAATLDRDDAPRQKGDPLPLLWHWLYFVPLHRQSELASDGHVKRGSFLPPIELPRRMWAGGRFEFHRPLRIGDAVRRTSRIQEVSSKQGRSGPLLFVVVRHEIMADGQIALTEEQDIVYRDYSSAASPPPQAPLGQAWQRTIHPDDVLLFRYSALTFNGHRIHYDRRYATEVEGYPGLVVHGPLIATLLMDQLRRNFPEANVRRFAFRAISPLFDTGSFFVCGQPDGDTIRLWAKNETGGLAMDATASTA